MKRRIEQVRRGVGAVLRELRREDSTFLAASIAYHAFVSLVPLLVLLLLAVSTLGGEQFVAVVVEMTSALLPVGRDVVTDVLRDARGKAGFSIVGIGVLLWGAVKIFRALDVAFAEIYDTHRELTLWGEIRDTLVVLVSLGAVAIGGVVLGSVVGVPATVPFAGAVDGLLAVLALIVALFPVYYVFPNVDVSALEVFPGVLLAAVGLVGLKRLFGLYVSLSSRPDIYGLVGALVLLVTWFYVGGRVVLVGVAVNATQAGRGGRTTDCGKRRFDDRIADIDDFEERVKELVEGAADADVAESDLRTALWRWADRVGDVRSGTKDDVTDG